MPRTRPRQQRVGWFPQEANPTPVFSEEKDGGPESMMVPLDPVILKEAANAQFCEGQIEAAADLYLEAIEVLLVESNDRPLLILGNICKSASEIDELSHPPYFLYNGAFAAFPDRPISASSLHKFVLLAMTDGRESCGQWPLALLKKRCMDEACTQECADPQCMNTVVQKLVDHSESAHPGAPNLFCACMRALSLVYWLWPQAVSLCKAELHHACRT